MKKPTFSPLKVNFLIYFPEKIACLFLFILIFKLRFQLSNFWNLKIKTIIIVGSLLSDTETSRVPAITGSSRPPSAPATALLASRRQPCHCLPRGPCPWGSPHLQHPHLLRRRESLPWWQSSLWLSHQIRYQLSVLYTYIVMFNFILIFSLMR